MKNRSASSTTTKLHSLPNGEEAELCVDNDTVFRDAILRYWQDITFTQLRLGLKLPTNSIQQP
jgi:hypothetical protein